MPDSFVLPPPDGAAVAAGRRRFAAMDRGDRMERMISDIENGIPKDRSFAVVDDKDSENWDSLARHIAASAAAGLIIAYDADW